MADLGETSGNLLGLPFHVYDITEDARVLVFAIRDKLFDDSVVTDQLATFKFETAGPDRPAIFTFDDDRGRIPETCALPAIIIDAIGAENFSTRGSPGARQIARIRVYGERKRKSILRLAWDIWSSVTQKDLLAESGFEIVANLCDSPQQLPDPEGYPGYVIAVRANVFLKTP